MLFSLKNKKILKSLKIGNITIKSRVYSFKDFYNFLNPDDKFILSCSPFIVSQWRKNQEIFYIKDFDNIDFLYTSFIFDESKDIFLNYIKWRLAVLWRIIKKYNIEKITIKQFFQFLLINTDLEIIQKLSYLFKFQEFYTLQDLKNFYKSCCSYKKQDKILLNYLSSIYKIDLAVLTELPNNTTDTKLLNMIVKILAKEFDLPTTIVRTYKKSLQKLKEYLRYKNIVDKRRIEKIIKEYKAEKDIIKTVENIVRGKKDKDKPRNFLHRENTKFEINKISF